MKTFPPKAQSSESPEQKRNTPTWVLEARGDGMVVDIKDSKLALENKKTRYGWIPIVITGEVATHLGNFSGNKRSCGGRLLNLKSSR